MATHELVGMVTKMGVVLKNFARTLFSSLLHEILDTPLGTEKTFGIRLDRPLCSEVGTTWENISSDFKKLADYAKF